MSEHVDAVDLFPRQGAGAPWELPMDYLNDRKAARAAEVGQHIRFSATRARRPVVAAA